MSEIFALPKLIMKTVLGKPAKQPTIEPAPIMPEADSDKIADTRKKAMINQQQRQGRASTMLSDSYDKLG
jgi:hypothetical protein